MPTFPMHLHTTPGIDLAADKRPRMVSSLRSKEKGEGSPIGLWRRRYKNKGPPFGLRLLASNDLLVSQFLWNRFDFWGF